MKPVELPNSLAVNTLQVLRQQSPLVHCLTNNVVQNVTANTLLALGAYPIMTVEPEEAAQCSTISDALLINIGTLYKNQADAMIAAINNANIKKIPWILDPVGIGILKYRSKFAHVLLSMKPTAIRGNASEILALAGYKTAIRGVDSGNSSLEALSAAIYLSKIYTTIVAVTGKQDLITNGNYIWQVDDGHPLMTRVAGIGCSLSAIVAACCTLSGNKLDNVASACRFMARAGRLTIPRVNGIGSLAIGIIDTLSMLSVEDLK